MVMSVGEEWPGCRNVLRASVAPTARLLTQEPGVRPDVTEGLFSLLQTLTKKRPQYIDWIDDMLLNLIELGLLLVLLLIYLVEKFPIVNDVGQRFLM